MKHLLTELAQSLPATVPFVGPETQERRMGQTFLARLGANENGFGPSPKAMAAMADTQVWQYGDPENHALRHALAAHHGIRPENIIVGEGIDGLLGYLVRLCVGPGDHVVTSQGSYPTFNYHVTGYGGQVHAVPYKDDRADTTALCAKAAEVQAKLIYLANPDNPMGLWLSATEIAAARAHLPAHSLLVLDEAYVECAPEGVAIPLDPEDTQILRMRTFSKVYGLAGARVGYAIGPAELIAAFDRVRNHFGMNRAAQAGALAALADTAYLAEVRQRIAQAREALGDIARAEGLKPLPSGTNFVTMDCGRDAAFAQAVLAHLVENRIFVRMPFVAPGNRCVRVSCGPDAELAQFKAALPRALEAAEKG